MVVRHAWHSLSYFHLAIQLFRRTAATRMALVKWNKNQFGCVNSCIKVQEYQMDNLQWNPSSHNIEDESDIKRELDEMHKHWKSIGYKNPVYT